MTTNKLIVTLLVGVSVVAFGSQALAQKGNAKRDAAMEKCIQQAGQIPGALEQANRTANYKACMTKAGFRP